MTYTLLFPVHAAARALWGHKPFRDWLTRPYSII